MTKFYFVLNVDLPPGHQDPMSYLDALYEAGCDDSLVGIGDSSLRVHFVRDGDDMYAVISEAEASVRKAIPDARVTWRWDREAEEYDRDNTPPVTGSGSFLSDRGYPDPALAKEKFLLAGKIRSLAEERSLDAMGIMTALKAIAVHTPSVEEIDAILRGQVTNVRLDTLKAVLAGLEGQR